MPHTTYTESTLAQGGWVGHDEGRALNTDASNAQTVSATESVPSRHRQTPRDRQRGSGTPEHRREQRPSKQTVPSTRNVHTLRYLHIHNTNDIR